MNDVRTARDPPEALVLTCSRGDLDDFMRTFSRIGAAADSDFAEIRILAVDLDAAPSNPHSSLPFSLIHWCLDKGIEPILICSADHTGTKSSRHVVAFVS